MAEVSSQILTIGDELLSGDTLNSNMAFLGQRARSLGLDVRRVLAVLDRVEDIDAALREAAREADVCLVSGGLGPTEDDVTTEAVARAVGVSLELDPAALARIEARFRGLGRVMPASNRKQAWLPRGAERLDNVEGTAPGFLVRLEAAGRTRVVACMPGVPRELERMMMEEVEPRLLRLFDLSPRPRRIYRVMGMAESEVAERLGPVLGERPRGAMVHYRARAPEVTVVVDAVAEGAAWLAGLDEPVGRVLAGALYGLGEADLPTRLVRALARTDLRLAVAESCTGGLAAELMTAVPGASAVFCGAVVAYLDRVKEEALGVPAALLRAHGAVSEPVARAMADRARERLGGDLGLGITGIAGPGGGSAEKPVGTVHLALSREGACDHRAARLPGNRAMVRRSAALLGLKMVWDHLVAHGLAARDV
jgi:nicotinamide-nucleotide amidase